MHKVQKREASIIKTKLAQLQQIKDNLKILGINTVLIQPNVNALNQLNTQKELNELCHSLN
ncbi:hypothetical protein BUY22_02285 [Staphylococcus cohnii]|nr:hypothetical protein BUY22_02285 [Staphylococcus cohnii]